MGYGDVREVVWKMKILCSVFSAVLMTRNSEQFHVVFNLVFVCVCITVMWWSISGLLVTSLKMVYEIMVLRYEKLVIVSLNFSEF